MATVAPHADALRGWRGWWLAARPRTLAVGVAPVWVGAALAFGDGVGRAGPALAALLGAVLLQIGANLANDLFDHERGADGPDRVGPPRAMQLGLFSARQMRGATAAVFGAAALVGLYLVSVGGWPVVAVGVAAIAAALAYTAGPYPLAYHGLGEAAALVFFGLVAVSGTYYVQALALPAHVLLVALPVGLLACAVLVVNNVRDRETDARVGKRTLAVRLGPRGARLEYVAIVAAAYALLPVLVATGAAGPAALLPFLTLPRAFSLVRAVQRESEPARLNPLLARTAQLALGFAVLLGAGLLP